MKMLKTKLNSSLYMMSLWIILITLFRSSHCYKILLLPHFGRSHVICMTSLGEELAGRGHEVHMMLGATMSLPTELSTNQSRIVVQRYGSPDVDLDYHGWQDNMTAQLIENNVGMGGFVTQLQELVRAETNQLLVNNDDLIKRLEKIKFDVAIVDLLFFNKYLYLIPLRLGVPWVTYSGMLPMWESRVPLLPSFVPSRLSTLTDRMSFLERLKNFGYTFGFLFLKHPADPHIEIIDEYRKYSDFSSTNDLVERSLLFLVTSDIALDYPEPLMPNIINIGGLSVKPASGRPLPQDIDLFMSSAKSGVILVTFGGMASRLPAHIGEKFMKAFENLPDYHIIWRFNNVDNLLVPQNVLLASWLPQNDLLADPRTLLFITHSGNGGQFEAMYHSVPMIGFPIMGDQRYNAQRLKARGFGIPMSFHDFSADELKQNILKIITDRSYKERINKASQMFRSAPDTPGQRAAHWIEHVIRFGGDHLRSAALDLNVIQYFMLDVVFVIVSVFVLLLVLVVILVKFIVRLFRKKSANERRNHSNIEVDVQRMTEKKVK